MMEITFFSALFGGLLTFLAPCTLPLIPGYIAFIGGDAALTPVSPARQRRVTLLNALFFVLGFSLVFILFGVASGAIGRFLILHRGIIASVGGIVVIFLGLSMLDLVKLPQISSATLGGVMKKIKAGTRTGAFLLGFLFALGWTPCLGPILGTIILLASTGGTALYGGTLLAVYSLGLAIPFLLIALLYGSTFTYVPKLVRYLPIIQKIGGMMIVLIGSLLVIGQFGILNTWASELIGQSTFDSLVEYM